MSMFLYMQVRFVIGERLAIKKEKHKVAYLSYKFGLVYIFIHKQTTAVVFLFRYCKFIY